MCSFFLLVGFELIDQLVVGNFFMAVYSDIPVPYNMEGVGAFDTFRCAVWDFSDVLAEAAKLLWVRLVPVLFEPVLAVELAMLKIFPQLGVVDGKVPLGDERVLESEARGRVGR